MIDHPLPLTKSARLILEPKAIQLPVADLTLQLSH